MLARGMCAYTSEVPEYQVINGNMHIAMCGTELVMPVNVFMQGMARSTKALDEWFASQQPKIVPIRRRH